MAIVCSRTLTGVPETLFSFVESLNALVLLRRGMKSPPGLFERAMAAFCVAHGINYEWVMPDPGQGREATFLRDVAMARRADLVLGFFDSEHMSGGTQHVVEAGIAASTPTYAWGLAGEHFVRIGEYDMDNTWGDRVPIV